MELAKKLDNVRAHVASLQTPTGAQEAAAWLLEFQQTPDALQCCASLVGDAFKLQDTATAFILTQTIAQHARRRSFPDSNFETRRAMVAQMSGILRAASSGQISPPAVVLRQVAAAATCFAMSCEDAMSEYIDQIVTLPCTANASPLIEGLRALVEEPLDNRVTVELSLRCRFIGLLRGRTPDVLRALGSAVALPSPNQLVASALKVAAAWLAAQLNFEEKLRMGEARNQNHPTLDSMAALLPVATRAARLGFDIDAFTASFEVFDTAVLLTHDVAIGSGKDVSLALLCAFGESFFETVLPHAVATERGANTSMELLDLLATTTAVVHSGFTSMAIMKNEAAGQGLVKMGIELLNVARVSGPMMHQSNGSLLESVLEAWDALATAHREAKEDGTIDASSTAHALVASAFCQLLPILPITFSLPAATQNLPEAWELTKRRDKASYLLLDWCADDQSRINALLQQLSALLANLPAPGADVGARWSELEMTLWFASSVSRVVFRGSVLSCGPTDPPELLTRLFTSLPQLPRTGLTRAQLLSMYAATSDFVCSFEPWITPESCPPSSSIGISLISFILQICQELDAPESAVAALAVLVSNLSSVIVLDSHACMAILRSLVALTLEKNLPITRRELLVQSTLGPLISTLPDSQLDKVFEELAQSLNAAALEAGTSSDEPVRILLATIAATNPSHIGKQLSWLATYWTWFELALTKWVTRESVVESACDALAAVLLRSKDCSGVSEILHRAVPLLAEAAEKNKSAPALHALDILVENFSGEAAGEIAMLLARHTLVVLHTTLSGGVSTMSQLPSDLVALLPRFLATVLAPRCAAVALILLQQQYELAGVVLAIVSMLPKFTCPQSVCWSLRACEQLPYWVLRPESQIAAVRVFQATLPGLAGAWCELVAVSPLIQEPEVLTALASVFRSVSVVAPDPVRLATGKALTEVEIDRGQQEILLLQIGNPSATQETFAEILRETANAKHSRARQLF